MADIKQWWAAKSTTNKTLTVIGTLITLGTVVYFGFYHNKPKSTTKPQQPAIDDDTKAQINTQPVPEQGVVDRNTLPNAGAACGLLRTNYDLDFDYVKCNNIWYTKSKENPSAAYAKGLYKDWISLQTNATANQRLNGRYPNG